MRDPAPDRSQASLSPSAPPLRMILLLVALTSVGPLSLNILVPAVPVLGRDFDADAATVQLTISLFLVGLAVSQLVLGPLSDRFGRRPVMVAGLLITILASVGAYAAATLSWLILARTIQALGASTGLVIGRAIIRDLYARDQAASMIGYVTMAMVMVPMIAPSIGGVLDTWLGWRSVFAFTALFVTTLLVWTLSALPETRAVAVSGGGLARFLEETAALAVDRNFAGYALMCGLSSAVFFAFLGGAPHVVISMMQRSSAEYGLWFAVSGLAYMAGNYSSARWSARLGGDVMIRWGAGLGIVSTLMLVATVVYFPLAAGPAVIFVPLMVQSVANGLLLPNAIAGAISVRPEAAGAGAGIVGFMQMGAGALAVQLVGYLLDGAATALPLALLMLICAVLSWSAFVLLVNKRPPRPPSPG